MDSALRKLEEEQRRLAEQQSELANRIAKLREPEHEPEPGDVYYHIGSFVLVINGDRIVSLPNGYVQSYNPVTSGSPAAKFVGKFHDVFTRKEVE